MSGWDTNYGYDSSQQNTGGFYDPNTAGYNYNYDTSGVQFEDYSNQSTNYQSNFDPQSQSGGFGGNFGGGAKDEDDEFANEPPLLEELGINPEHIFQKTLTVLNPFRSTRTDVAGDADLAGPLCFCVALGFLLLLSGKVHFNYIYGIGLLGCVANYGLLSMMATTPVSITVVVSVLGYCLLPIVALSALSILISLTGVVGTSLTVIAVIWSALSASKVCTFNCFIFSIKRL